MMNTAEILIDLLEGDGNRFIFGHPGEQILPFYRALKDSSMEHVLVRHEQAAAHAADAYARASGEYGICISTAGPGAMNLVMGVSTAFKDSVPMLVITGDNDYSTKDSDIFQSFPINSVFQGITVKSFHPCDGKAAVYNMIEALAILHSYPKGPVHINLSKDVLLEDVSIDSIDLQDLNLSDFGLVLSDSDKNSRFDLNGDSLKGLYGSFAFNPGFDESSMSQNMSDDSKSISKKLSDDNNSLSLNMSDDSNSFSRNMSDDSNSFSRNMSDDSNLNNSSQKLSSYVDTNMELAIKKLQVCRKPLVIVGNGVVWSKAIDKLNDFLIKTGLPIVTTYHSKGIVSEDNRLNLGIVGIRGNSLSNYAYSNADCILVLGAKLSERTIGACDFSEVQDKIIHVNIDEDCLKGNVNLCMDVSDFLDLLLLSIDEEGFEFKGQELDDGFKSKNGIGDEFKCSDEWIDEIYSHYEEQIIDGIDDIEENFNPLRPPYAISRIVDAFEGSHFLSDAGTHTTWTTLLVKSDSFGKLLFSGGFGPMGYSLPGAIGVAFALKKANRDGNVVVICGDGDIQMVIQELATVREYGLNINIFVIDNSQLGIIRQWEETVYDIGRYEVDLVNPDFAELANAYGIESMKVESREGLESAIDRALNSDKAFLSDVCVCEENIPLPKRA